MADDPSLFGADAAPSSDKPGHDPFGHRSRLRQRLLAGDDEALGDHEIIELLLIQAVPRRDMKPLARTLIDRFGSLAAVLTTDARTVAAHPGMGEATAAALKIVVLAARRLARQKVREAPVIGSWQTLIDYLTIDMAHLTRERVRVLYPNASSNRNMANDPSTSASGKTGLLPREILRRVPKGLRT